MHLLSKIDLPGRLIKRGKVRDCYELPDGRLFIVTTDRLSAYDRSIGLVSYKGQILNRLSAHWFFQLYRVVPHHLLDVPDPNVSIVRRTEPFPVEVVVRGYLTGSSKTSLWPRYRDGLRRVGDVILPEGLVKNDLLPDPVITAALRGEFDEWVDPSDVPEAAGISAEDWETVKTHALMVFNFGQTYAKRAGLRLLDAKYEFGRDREGKVILIDEVHTGDSARFIGPDGTTFDKDYARRWVKEHPGQSLPDEVADELSWRYIELYNILTGRTFVPDKSPPEERIRACWSRLS